MIRPTKEPRWLRSPACSGGNCVEIAKVGGRYLIRDAKNPDVAPLSFSADEWDAFARAVKQDEFRFE
jgi:uncharacterized protein DUF397